MKIYLNDKIIEFACEAEPTVSRLAEQENIGLRGVALALNDKVVRKNMWDTTLLKEGDKVTVVKIAFGG